MLLTTSTIASANPFFYVSSYADMDTAMSEIGATPATLIIDDDTVVTNSLAVPSTIALVGEGGVITITSAKTLTINGSVASDVQIFDPATGSVRFGPGVLREVHPHWWGALADDDNDDRPAVQAALDSLPAMPGSGDEGLQDDAYGGIVKLPRGTFKITSPLLVQSYQWLVGSGPGTIIHNTADNTPAISIGAGTVPAFRVHLRDLTIQGSGTAERVAGGYGILAQKLYRSIIGPIWINNTTDSGIYLGGSGYSYIRDSYIQGCWGHGISAEDRALGADFWITSTTITGCTIRLNRLSGIYMVQTTLCKVIDNTIEANCWGEYVGNPAKLTDHWCFVNLQLIGTYRCTVRDNYFEQGGNVGVTAYGFQIAISGGAYDNRIIANDFASHRGILLWSATAPYGVNYNLIAHNTFVAANDPNFETQYYPAESPATLNYIYDNFGLNWLDQGSSYWNNTICAAGFGGDLPHNVQEDTATGAAEGNYYPDFGPINSAGHTAGARRGNVLVLNLQADVHMKVNNAPPGSVLTFIFVQDGTGGWDVDWDASTYVVTWDNTGNTANKISVVTMTAGLSQVSNKSVQVGPQVPWQ